MLHVIAQTLPDDKVDHDDGAEDHDGVDCGGLVVVVAELIVKSEIYLANIVKVILAVDVRSVQHVGISTVVELEWALDISIGVNELFRDAMDTLNHFILISSLNSHHGLVLVVNVKSIFL